MQRKKKLKEEEKKRRKQFKADPMANLLVFS